MSKKNTTKQTATNSLNNPTYLLLIAFLEGACLMIIELLGAKIIAPFYGTSLYVWSSVLGVTLASLAIGYFYGGVISQKYKTDTPLVITLLVGTVFFILAPNIAPFIMKLTSGLGVRFGSLLAVFLYLTPPVICMGMVSPIITQRITKGSSEAGRSAGRVYAISTLGGIIATFLAGFYLIPSLGIKTTAILTGGILIFCVVFILLMNRKSKGQIAAIVVLFLITIALTASKNKIGNSQNILRYQSSGILGEWKVVDHLASVDNGKNTYSRHLLLNGVDQTSTQVGYQPLSSWRYPHKIGALSGLKPKGAKALLLGMGGGSLADILVKLNFEVDIVELDERIPFIAKKWFAYNPALSNLIIDDARHYMSHIEKKYDLVIMDMVNGEVQPSHVFTREGLSIMKKVLKEDALIIVNFQGRINLDDSSLTVGPRSVFKTFQAEGFDIHIANNREGSESLSRDMLMYGSPGALDFENLFEQEFRYNSMNPFDDFVKEDYTPYKSITLDDAMVFTDDKPNLEILNAPAILEWRKKKMNLMLKTILKSGIEMY